MHKKANTYPSVKDIKLDKNKHLIICDADEVIFHFMPAFEKFLKTKGLYFSWESYKLNGNIKNYIDNDPVKDKCVKKLIISFFKINTIKLKTIRGAAETLAHLSKNYNILILSNLPFAEYESRVLALKNNGMPYQLIANSGGKGIAISEITKNFRKNIWFIDDSPNQLQSVGKYKESAKRIHFLSHVKLSLLIGKVSDCEYSAKNWSDIKKIIEESEKS